MKKLFLEKELINNLSQEGTLTYVALRTIMLKDIELECVSMNRLAFTLVGQIDYEKVLIDSLEKGIKELVSTGKIFIYKDLSTKASSEYILDISKLNLNTEKTPFIIIDDIEVYKILTCKEVMKKKINMLKYFIALIGTFDMSSHLKCWGNMPNLQGKIGHMSQQYISEQAGISTRTCQRYNEILEESELIYIYKSNDKIRIEDRLKQIKNCYSRYLDKDACEMYASNYENIYGHNHKIVMTKKSKEKADENRRLGAIYNQIGWGNTDYDEETIKAVYKYITNVNKSLQEEIDKKNGQTYLTASDELWIEKLKSKMRDTSIFEQFEFCLPKKSEGTDDYWGEMIDFMPWENEEFANLY